MKRTSMWIALLMLGALCAPLGMADQADDQPRQGLSVWDDPGFRDRFLGSYGFNSEIEPPVRPEELDALNAVLALMGEGDLDGAEQRLLQILESGTTAAPVYKEREADRRRAAKVAEQRAKWERKRARLDAVDASDDERAKFEQAYAAWQAEVDAAEQKAYERAAKKAQAEADRERRKRENNEFYAQVREEQRAKRKGPEKPESEKTDKEILAETRRREKQELRDREKAEKAADELARKERKAREKAFDARAKGAEDIEEAVREPSAVFHFVLGNVYFEQEDWARAGEQFELATAKFPSYRRAYKNLGLVYVRQNRLQEAIAPLSQVVQLGGEDGLVYGLLGYAYSSAEQWVAAESAYRNAMMLDPKTMDWKLGLTQSVMRQQKYGETIALGDELIAHDPDNADFWMLQAGAYIGNGQPLKAAQNYELLDRMGKGSVNSLNTLGDIYVNEQMWGLAARAYGRAAELDDSGDGSRLLRNVESLAMRGALDQAKTLVARIHGNEAIALDDEEKIRLLKLESRIAVADGASGDSIRILEEIVELNPLDGEALILLGQHYAAAGDPDQAIFHYERAQSLEEFEADASMRHAQVLVDQARFKEAVPLLKRAQELRPRDDVGSYLEQIERAARAQR